MLVSQIGSWTADMWGAVIGLFSFIPSWGWMIIVFTVCLKLILSPLDFWQRKVSRESMKKQAVLQPELAKIQKKFGNNKQMLNQKTMELYKRENFNMFGSCGVMLLNMAITLFVFITLFYGLMGISQTQVLNQYNSLEEAYNANFAQVYNIEESEISSKEAELWQQAYQQASTELNEGATEDVTEEQIYSRALEIFISTDEMQQVQQAVLAIFNDEVKESWLWIDNVWRPDTNSSAFPDYQSFVSQTNFYSSEQYTKVLNERLESLPEGATDEQRNEITTEVQKSFEQKYDFVTSIVQQEYSSWNGYFILVVLSAVITYLSLTITQGGFKKKKNQEEDPTNAIGAGKAMKFMRFLLPILMIIFTIGYSAAFALYIVTNSLMSMIISLISMKILETIDKKKKVTITTKNRPEYSR